jgi:hypothetical protein
MSRDNFWFTRVVGIRIRNEAPPDPEMGPGMPQKPQGRETKSKQSDCSPAEGTAAAFEFGKPSAGFR